MPWFRAAPWAAGWRLASFLVFLAPPALPAQLAEGEAAEGEAAGVPRDTQAITSPLLSPDEARAAMRVPEGFRVSLFAAEPDVQQPIAMAWDARGRLWVAENYTYAERPVGNDLRYRDRILILEDDDHDGQSDRRKVFWDGGQRLTSVEVGFGGVWALCPPELLFIPDRDGDDVPDGAPRVVLDGFAADAARHNFVNGLRWGPDGWLYGRHGITVQSMVGIPGTPENQRTAMSCGIWRYHPQQGRFEVVCLGTTNPWGMDWDDHGQLFFINTVIGHLWHVVPGAHYQRMFGDDFNPHLYALIEQTADHFHWDTGEHWSEAKKGLSASTGSKGGGHAHCGMMIYLGDNWPRSYRGELFALNLHGRRMNQDHPRRAGATYTAEHRPDFMQTGDVWFRGIDLGYGPDGGTFVLDWSDLGECHENDGVHRTSGRIFKIVWGEDKTDPPLDLNALSSRQLAEMQLHANDWHVRIARRLLQQRAAAGLPLAEAEEALRSSYAGGGDVPRRLRALWALYSIGAVDEDWLVAQLKDPSEHVRTWAVKLLVDQGAPGEAAGQALVDHARRERSGLVLTFLASAMQRLPDAAARKVGAELVGRREWAGDRVLPLMTWYGLERLVPGDPLAAVKLVETSQLPRVSRFLARRLTYELDSQPEAVERLTQYLLRAGDRQRLAVLEGMGDATRGWQRARAPASWPRLQALLGESGDPRVAARVRELSVVFGDGRATTELVALARDPQEDAETRRRALRALIDVRADGITRLLIDLLPDRTVGPSAARGLAAVGGEGTADTLLEQFPRLHASIQPAVLESMASRPRYADALLSGVEHGTVPREHIRPFLLRQLQLMGDPERNARIARLWPEQRLIAGDKLKQITRLRTRLDPETLAAADLNHGARLFRESCGKCHRLFGQGDTIGPDLTGAQRTNLDYLLENILDPSASLAANYRLSVLALADGRVISGVIVGRGPRTWTVQTATEKLVIPRDEIERTRATRLSLMPDGLLDPLNDQQIRDLFAYLMSRNVNPEP